MVFTKHRRADIENHKLFCGKDPESRFGTILKTMTDNNPNILNLVHQDQI
jgi:hypothetical protein